VSEIDKLAADCDALRWIVEFNRRDRLRLLDKIARANFAAARATVLYAAIDRLHTQADRESVLHVVEDILTNVIGVERFEIRTTDDEIEGATAVVPLRFGSQKYGAIAVFGEIPERSFGREVLEAVATHAAIALCRCC